MFLQFKQYQNINIKNQKKMTLTNIISNLETKQLYLLKNTTMDKKTFKKGIKIYNYHPLKNGLISINFAYILDKNTRSASKKIVIEKNGGALNSLYIHKCEKNDRKKVQKLQPFVFYRTKRYKTN